MSAQPLRESGVVRQAWQERPILMNVAAFLAWWITATLLILFDTGAHGLPKPHHRGTGRSDVAMAMSGGGYRAALFHMGVLHELENNSVPTERGGPSMKVTPGVVSAVSGGAIAAAYFACGGSPTTFLDTFAADRLSLPRQILRADHLVRLAIGGISRVEVHAELLGQELLGETRMRDAAGFDPALLLCTTDLLSGDLVGWSGGSCIVHSPPAIGPPPTSYLDQIEELWWRVYGPGSRPVISDKTVLALQIADDKDYGNAPLSRLVAASAAFPGVFDPLQLSLTCSHRGGVKEPGQRFELVDGGVLDNSGLSLLLAAVWRGIQPNSDGSAEDPYAAYRSVKTIVECDASQTLESSLTPTNTITSLLRSGDLVHSDASSSSRQRLAAEAKRMGLHYVLVSPHQLWRNRPIQGTASLQEPIEASPAMRAFSDIANRIDTERQLHPDAGDRSWVLDILQQKLIDLAVRHFVASQRPEVLLAMFDVAGIDHRSLTVAELRGHTLPQELSQLRGVQDPPRERLLSLGDEQLCQYLGRTVHRFQSVALEQLYDDVRNCYYEFRNMSTLVDEAPPLRAQRVFRLGRYILLSNIDAIHRALTQP